MKKVKKQKGFKIKDYKIKNLPIQGFYINSWNNLYVQLYDNEIFKNHINKIVFIENDNYTILGRVKELRLSGIMLNDWCILNRG